jgi:hypothetical protein
MFRVSITVVVICTIGLSCWLAALLLLLLFVQFKFCCAAVAVAVVCPVQKYSVELGVSFRLQQQPAGQTEIIK